MTVYKLIAEYQNHNPSGHFFDRDTLKFFGERISEMRILKNMVCKTDYSGEKHSCYVLSTLQRNAPCGASRAYHFFDSETFEQII